MSDKTYTFSERKRRKLILGAFAVGVDILAMCDYIAHNFKNLGGSEYFCAGLYTHALEEYGKVLWLQNLPVNNGQIKINKKKYADHVIKFNMIKHDTKLPDVCKKIRIAPFDNNIFDSNIFDTKDTYANQFTRFQIFYSDFADNGELLQYPPIDKNALSEAIKELSNVFLKLAKDLHDDTMDVK